MLEPKFAALVPTKVIKCFYSLYIIIYILNIFCTVFVVFPGLDQLLKSEGLLTFVFWPKNFLTILLEFFFQVMEQYRIKKFY